MNKEIKFNFWQPSTNKMLHWSEYIEYGIFELFNNNDSIPLQFTGLKDCNGKDIYQGDICKIYFDVKRVEDYIYNSLTEIEMVTGSRIFVVDSPIFNNQVEFTADKIEVIGNIYQNAELL